MLPTAPILCIRNRTSCGCFNLLSNLLSCPSLMDGRGAKSPSANAAKKLHAAAENWDSGEATVFCEGTICWAHCDAVVALLYFTQARMSIARFGSTFICVDRHSQVETCDEPCLVLQ